MHIDDLIIWVKYAFIPPEFDNERVQSALRLLPDEEQKRFFGFKSRLSALQFLFGRLLLRHHLPVPAGVSSLAYSGHGKPFWENAPDWHFSLAHARGLVMCACARGTRVGIDVEQIRAVDLDAYGNCFTEKEWQELHRCENAPRRFFELWTGKEAIAKADGRGLALPFNTIDIDEFVSAGGTDWSIRPLDLHGDFVCTLAWEAPACPRIETHRIEKIDCIDNTSGCENRKIQSVGNQFLYQ